MTEWKSFFPDSWILLRSEESCVSRMRKGSSRACAFSPLWRCASPGFSVPADPALSLSDRLQNPRFGNPR